MFPISNDMKMKINKIQNAFDAEKIFDWDQEESFLALPFVITLGTQNATEAGYEPDIGDDINVSPLTAGYFEQVFNGREPILAQWEGQSNTLGNRTTIITQDPNSQKYEPNVERDFAIGRSIRVWSQLTQAGTSFGSSGGFSGQTATRNIICFTNEVLTETDEYKLYLIPTLAQDQWLYIKDIQRVYMPNKTYSHSLITFDTLMDSLEVSGLAQEEYVQRASPGDAYAWPRVYNDNDNIEQVQLDQDYLKYQPITDVQIQYFGVAGHSQITFQARPVFKGDDYTKVRVDRLTLPFQMNTPLPDQISSNVIPEQNMYYLGLAQPTILSQYDNWKDKVQAQYDQFSQKTFEGDLITNYTVTSNTNPLNGSSYKYSMWDNTWIYTTPSSFILNVAGNGICNAAFLNNKTIGNSTLDLSSKSLAFKEFNLFNYCYHNQHQLLSLGDKQNTIYTVKNIPVVGWALNDFVGGYPIGWKNQSENPYTYFDGINIMMSAPLYQAYTTSVYAVDPKTNQGFVPLDVFRDDGTDNIGAIIGAQSSTSVFNFSLSDQISIQRKYVIDGTTIPFVKTVSSIYLGQRDDDLTSYYLVDKDTLVAPKATNTLGYIIDLTSFQSLGKSDYKITFYSNDPTSNKSNPVWTGRYTSNSKYADNIRQWTTIVKYNDTPDVKFKLPWPLPLPQPALSNDKTFYLDSRVPTTWVPTQTTTLPQPLDTQGSLLNKINIDLTLGVNMSQYKSMNILFEMANDTAGTYVPPKQIVYDTFPSTIDLTNVPTVDVTTITDSNFKTFLRDDFFTTGANPAGVGKDMYKSYIQVPGLQDPYISQYRGVGSDNNPGGTDPTVGYTSMLSYVVKDSTTGYYFLITTTEAVSVYYNSNGGQWEHIEYASEYTYNVIDEIELKGNSVSPGKQSKTWNLDPKFGMVLNTLATIGTYTQANSNGTDFGLYVEQNTGVLLADINYYDLNYEVDYYDTKGTLITTENRTLNVNGNLQNPASISLPGMYSGVSPITNWTQIKVGGVDPVSGQAISILPSDIPIDSITKYPSVGSTYDWSYLGLTRDDFITQTTILMNNSKTTGKVEFNLIGTLNSTPKSSQPFGTVAYKPKTITAYWGQ